MHSSLFCLNVQVLLRFFTLFSTKHSGQFHTFFGIIDAKIFSSSSGTSASLLISADFYGEDNINSKWAYTFPRCKTIINVRQWRYERFWQGLQRQLQSPFRTVVLQLPGMKVIRITSSVVVWLKVSVFCRFFGWTILWQNAKYETKMNDRCNWRSERKAQSSQIINPHKYNHVYLW